MKGSIDNENINNSTIQTPQENTKMLYNIDHKPKLEENKNMNQKFFSEKILTGKYNLEKTFSENEKDRSDENNKKHDYVSSTHNSPVGNGIYRDKIYSHSISSSNASFRKELDINPEFKQVKYSFQQYTGTPTGLKRYSRPDFSEFQSKLRHVGPTKRTITFTDVEFVENSMNTKTIQRNEKNYNHKFKIQMMKKNNENPDTQNKTMFNEEKRMNSCMEEDSCDVMMYEAAKTLLKLKYRKS